MKFGISNNIRSRVVRECTPELLKRAIDSPMVARVCAEIADALEAVRRGEMSRPDFDTLKAERKRSLPVITPHATFANGRRVNADAVPSGLVMYDVDHISNPRGYYKEKVHGREAGLGIVLAHVTPSLEGLRLVFVNPAGGMTLADAQMWMSRQLGDAAYDGAVKDLARCSFLVPRDYILYLNEERMFSDVDAPMADSREVSVAPLLLEGGVAEGRGGRLAVQVSDGALPTTSPCGDSSFQKEESSVTQPSAAAPLCFRGIPYASIIQQWFALTGGEPVQGERNTRLHRLASHLRYITDNDEGLMLQVMPRYGLSEEEMKGLIHSACTSKWYSTPKEMKEAIGNEELKMKNEELSADDDKNSSFGGAADILHSTLKEELPPSLPPRLPDLIKLLVSRTPEVYKPAVAHAVFPSLAAHLHRVRFCYIDNVEHEATLMNVLMAGTGAGKDCISEPINRIMADIRRRDEDNLRREREWKREVTSKGANKDKRQRPEGLVIQEIDADMTNPAFVMRMAEADGHFLYTKLNEIDQFDALRGSGRGGQQFQIMCLAFDPGNRYGQTRVGTQSVTEKVQIRFNWNASTTIQKGKRYFAKVLTDGPISRINFCTIPEREIGADMPVYGSYDAGFDEELRPYIENLVKAQGLVDCPQAYKLAQKLKEECADQARLSQSRVYENLSFRALVIAWLKACVLYVAQGCKWDKTIEDFVRWSLQYDLWCKMEFFGDGIAQAMSESQAEGKRHGRMNLLTLLPDEFTLADAIRMRQSQGMDADGTRQMLWQWTYRHYITKLTINNKQIYQKTEQWKSH